MVPPPSPYITPTRQIPVDESEADFRPLSISTCTEGHMKRGRWLCQPRRKVTDKTE
jgi:hypothetical protein